MNEPNAPDSPEVEPSDGQQTVETIEAIQTLFQPVRYRIFKHLREHHDGSYIQEIADELNEDRQLVTHHLMKLAKHGFVDSEYEVSTEPASKGRAKKVYTLTDRVEELKPEIEDLLE